MRTTAAMCLSLVLAASCAHARPATAPPYPAQEVGRGGEEPAADGAPAEPEAVMASREVPGQGGKVAQAPTPAATAESSAGMRDMLDIEATLDMVVERLGPAALELRKLVQQQGGVLVEDHVDEAGQSRGEFLIRVDAPKTDAMLAALEQLGQVRTRQVDARDIGKQYRDAELLLANLKVTMARFEQILTKADKVADILTIEHELTRLRGEIEQVKGNLRWMQDRVARSTIHVTMFSQQASVPQGPIAPEAKLYPGVRGLFLEDMRGNDVQQGYWGAGISLRANRYFSLDIDGYRRTSTGSPTKGLDIVLATIGGEFYSQFLGNGARRFANPYLGWRMGYARFLRHNEFALGATVGLEVVKTRAFTVDLAVRGFGLLGDALHMAVQPELTVGFAF